MPPGVWAASFIAAYALIDRQRDSFASLSGWATILGFAYVRPFDYLFYSLRHGEPAGPNPWDVKGLEWTVPSPPPKHNFEEMPVVTEPPYNYPIEMEDGHER